MALLQTKINQYRISATAASNGEVNYSDAHHREHYSAHSLQVINPGAQTVIVQLSNKETPAEETDADWFGAHTITTSTMVALAIQKFRWIRFKFMNDGASVASCHLLSDNRSNT